MASPPLLAWHQALVYALTGVRHEELGRQPAPDVASVAAYLQSDGAAVASGGFAVPADLLQDIGAAQFSAALASLRAQVAPLGAAVVRDRPLDADERRLLTDVPPHHGG